MLQCTCTEYLHLPNRCLTTSIHLSSIPSSSFSGSLGFCSLSQQPLGNRQGTTWACHQSIIGRWRRWENQSSLFVLELLLSRASVWNTAVGRRVSVKKTWAVSFLVALTTVSSVKSNACSQVLCPHWCWAELEPIKTCDYCRVIWHR